MKSILFIFLLLQSLYAEKSRCKKDGTQIKDAHQYIIYEHPRRPQAIHEADKLILAGRNSYRNADYEKAVTQYRAAIHQLDNYTGHKGGRTHSYVTHYAQGVIVRSNELDRTGRSSQATQLLLNVIAIDPENKDARTELQSRLKKLPPLFYFYQALGYLRSKNKAEAKKSLSTYILHQF